MLLWLYSTYNSAKHHPEQLSICPPHQSEPIEAVSHWKLAPHCWEGLGSKKRLGVFICNSNVQKLRLWYPWRFRKQEACYPESILVCCWNSLWLQQEVGSKRSLTGTQSPGVQLTSCCPHVVCSTERSHWLLLVYVKPLPEGKSPSLSSLTASYQRVVSGKQPRRMCGEDRHMTISLFPEMTREVQGGGSGSKRLWPLKC